MEKQDTPVAKKFETPARKRSQQSSREHLAATYRDIPSSVDLDMRDPRFDAQSMAEDQRWGPSVGFTLCGPRCPRVSRCELRESQDIPSGTQCPLELQLFSTWATDLAREFELQAEDSVDLSQVKEIAWLMLEEWRAQQVAADEPMLVDSLKGFTPRGEQLTEPRLNPVYSLREKIAARKQKLLDSLMATRHAKSRDRSEKREDVNALLLNMTNLVHTLKDQGYAREAEVIDPDPRGFLESGPQEPRDAKFVEREEHVEHREHREREEREECEEHREEEEA